MNASPTGTPIVRIVDVHKSFGTSEVLFSPLLYQASATVTWFLPSRLAW